MTRLATVLADADTNDFREEGRSSFGSPYFPASIGDLLETDNRYFELASTTRQLPGGQLSWMPGCTSIPLGCVIVRVGQPSSMRQANRWTGEFEAAVDEIGGRIVRLYLQDRVPLLEDALRQAGYQGRAELAFLSPTVAPPQESSVSIRQVVTKEDFQLKSDLEAESSTGPDGHSLDPRPWQEALCAKWKTKLLHFYFIERDGNIVGTIGAMQGSCILRLKNLVIRPAFRQQGFGREAVFALWRQACDDGRLLGTFGVQGDAGCHVYLSAGLKVTAAQVEWSISLPDREGKNQNE